ncbi:MAG: hypothetical protein WBF77_11600, partial [Sulfurimonadaceae bacterium]
MADNFTDIYTGLIEVPLEFLTLHGVFIIGEVLIVLTMLHMLYQRRSPTSMISWLLMMIIVPYLF